MKIYVQRVHVMKRFFFSSQIKRPQAKAYFAKEISDMYAELSVSDSVPHKTLWAWRRWNISSGYLLFSQDKLGKKSEQADKSRNKVMLLKGNAGPCSWSIYEKCDGMSWILQWYKNLFFVVPFAWSVVWSSEMQSSEKNTFSTCTKHFELNESLIVTARVYATDRMGWITQSRFHFIFRWKEDQVMLWANQRLA